jgi:hypothetical protein
MDPPLSQLTPEWLDAAVELMGRAGRAGTVRVQGRSMLPTLVEGQQLAVDFQPERLATGDMLIFRQHGHLVVHRFLGGCRFPDGRPGLRTRGDGCHGFDPHVHRSQVIGRVTAFRLDGEWRSTRTLRGRVYGKLVAWHDLFWSVSGLATGRLVRGLSRLGIRVPLVRWVASADRRLLGIAHRVLFVGVHPVVASPAEDGAVSPGPAP